MSGREGGSTPPAPQSAMVGPAIMDGWREWFASAEGAECAAASTLGLPPNMERYLVHRLERAFIAGASLPRAAPQSVPEGLRERLADECLASADWLRRQDWFEGTVRAQRAADRLTRAAAALASPQPGDGSEADRLRRIVLELATEHLNGCEREYYAEWFAAMRPHESTEAGNE